MHNGVDSSYFHPGLSVPFKRGDPQLLFVGNLYPHKNVSSLITGMSEICETYPRAHLQVAGKGEVFSELQKQIQESGLQKQVELVGQPAPDELRLRYSSCDIYVSASRWEMFDLPALEAMSCGKPVLLSDIPAHTELITGSNAGLTFSLNSSTKAIVQKIVAIYENRSTFGEAGRRFGESHDWAIVCEKIAKVYEQTISAI
ncbi:MAG: glycosyltransferase family 4 protein [Nitrososphaera sp.]